MFAEDDHDNGYTCKDPKYCYGKYTMSFQIFQIQDLYNLGDAVGESFTGFSTSGDSSTFINTLGPSTSSSGSTGPGIVNALGLANDAMKVINSVYMKESTPYDQQVTVSVQTRYEGAPYNDAERVVSVTGISITNNSDIQQVMNYALNIEGSGFEFSSTGSAAPGETVAFEFSPVDLYYDGISIKVRAYSGCSGACIQPVKPAKYSGYLQLNVSPY